MTDVNGVKFGETSACKVGGNPELSPGIFNVISTDGRNLVLINYRFLVTLEMTKIFRESVET